MASTGSGPDISVEPSTFADSDDRPSSRAAWTDGFPRARHVSLVIASPACCSGRISSLTSSRPRPAQPSTADSGESGTDNHANPFTIYSHRHVY